MHRGSCLCGHITYEITQTLGDYGFCHCKSCRKASGSAHAANIGILRKHFQLSDPDQLIREFESAPGKFRAFCSRCGSPLYAYLSDSAETVRIRLGSLDTEFETRPKVHSFVAHRASWDVIEGDIPQYPEWAPRSALVQLGSKQPQDDSK